eukprot:3072841-Rhodomonas_salina.1
MISMCYNLHPRARVQCTSSASTRTARRPAVTLASGRSCGRPIILRQLPRRLCTSNLCLGSSTPRRPTRYLGIGSTGRYPGYQVGYLSPSPGDCETQHILSTVTLGPLDAPQSLQCPFVRMRTPVYQPARRSCPRP